MNEDTKAARWAQSNLSRTWTIESATGASGEATFLTPADGHTQAIIAERERTHGAFRENSKFAQDVKATMRNLPSWNRMASFQREALDMIAHKMTRILHGDPDHLDHWDDIAGYAERASSEIRERSARS